MKTILIVWNVKTFSMYVMRTCIILWHTQEAHSCMTHYYYYYYFIIQDDIPIMFNPIFQIY